MEVKQCLRPPRVAVTLKVIGRGAGEGSVLSRGGEEGSGFEGVGSVFNEPASEEVGSASSEGAGLGSEEVWSVFKGEGFALHEAGSAPKMVVR